MRFNKQELVTLAMQPSTKFEKEGILYIRERQEGFFRKSESKSIVCACTGGKCSQFVLSVFFVFGKLCVPVIIASRIKHLIAKSCLLIRTLLFGLIV